MEGSGRERRAAAVKETIEVDFSNIPPNFMNTHTSSFQKKYGLLNCCNLEPRKETNRISGRQVKYKLLESQINKIQNNLVSRNNS